tara:strand:+ start:3710 stop:4267 length:558 start_codon:yes stop_codon:yes gene_type:complete
MSKDKANNDGKKSNHKGVENLNPGRFGTVPGAAKAASDASIAARRAKKAANENLMRLLGGTNDTLKSMKSELKDFDPVDLLNIIAIEKMDAGEIGEAVDILKSTAPFIREKLSSKTVEQKTTNYNALSMEELQTLSTITQAVDMLDNGVEPAMYLTNKGLPELAGKAKAELIEFTDLIKRKAGEQ